MIIVWPWLSSSTKWHVVSIVGHGESLLCRINTSFIDYLLYVGFRVPRIIDAVGGRGALVD